MFVKGTYRPFFDMYSEITLLSSTLIRVYV